MKLIDKYVKSEEDMMVFALVVKHLKYLFICLLLVGLVYLIGCAGPQKEYYCSDFIQQMNSLWCEDATLVGYTAAYLGHDEWKKLTDSFNEAREKSAYGFSCKPWNGHWYGRTIRKENTKEVR